MRSLENPELFRNAAKYASGINDNGFTVIQNFISEEQLARLRDFVAREADTHPGGYFAYHGSKAVAMGDIRGLSESAELLPLLGALYQQGAGQPAFTDDIHPVLRCVQGESGRSESNRFHFDASFVTALLPIEVPDATIPGEQGNLLVFANRRRIRRTVLANVIEKTLIQNAFTKRLITLGIRLHLLRPQRIRLVPGNLYLFWGYRSLHASEPCPPTTRRSTLIFHYGDPHAGSLATALILAFNQHRARRATQSSQQAA